MLTHIAHVAYLVRDYDEAIRWFVDKLGFVLIEDTPREPGKRWVRIAPQRDHGVELLLAKAANDEQASVIGKQGGGRVTLFLYTDNFAADHERLLNNGVKFLESPRHESYGSVAVFEDLYGMKWDLLQMKV